MICLISIAQMHILLCNTSAMAVEKTRKTIDLKSCKRIITSKLPEYQKLYQALGSIHVKASKHPIVTMLDMKPSECKDIGKRKSLQLAFGAHSKKIGILLPNNRSFHTPIISRSMDYAVQDYFQKNGLDMKKHVVIKRHARDLNSLKIKLAELVFRSGASIIIGGITKAHETYLIEMSQKLEIPVIISRPKQSEALIDRQIFHVGPSSVQMVEYFLSFFKQQGLQRLAIVHPTNQHRFIIEQIRSKFEQKKMPEPVVKHYNSESFSSIESSLKDLFHIQPEKRKVELNSLDNDKKTDEIARPVVDVDAVMILDNFKNARHIISVMKYLNVQRITLIGNQQWRSSELFQPPEPMLSRSFFFDYIGNYSELPFGLDKYGNKQSWFLPVETSESLDIKLIMTSAVDAAYRALQDSNKPRYRLYRNLKHLAPADKRFFRENRLFDRNNNSQWPFYIFSLDRDQLKDVQVARKNQRA